ncbi:kinetochore protein Spc25 [Ammospiza nelsoni]|uniref:Kinetochore protein SPC25 n=1 Tax=Zonotrichia albicollis TaxID=44394 RepID=A0A8D2NET6_ZONAL|nr:kinetochore protein Spc25 [Zonotrichia albicollis]XP_058665781.1 kinetochore protein Spc25 [Ammospiza caudacuta]XP_058665782.1 kinetochore protein Spc25 [Ammospiza caudacuta]XP_058665783.1 kinetochore protein Spc25 [Ammospiza caudacuta]XP_059331894.1 kinetochore protein Spc25 [Ammospiza nelsoni]XP_059331895.1 kinetochore protein Spc25 [Ammospiza nelsoni]XP_059331896.1 kinetochore protein Spc25 [Ammospiza nelsoni]
MGNAPAEDEVTLLERDMKEFWNQFKFSYGTEQNNQTSALRDLCKETLEALAEKWSKKLKEEDVMIDKIHEYNNEILQQSKYIAEKEEQLTEIRSELNQEQEQQKNLMDSIEELKQELMKKMEIKSSKNKAAKEKLEQVSKIKTLFKEHLALEMRRIPDEQLQFIFRHIDHKDPDKPYVCTLSINEQGDYEVNSCTPPLDCIAELQLKLRETNNFSAFVANIRKAFTALSYKQSA